MAWVTIAAALIAAGALYIRLRWRRAPQAYRAMIAVAVCYLVAGAVLGGLIIHLVTPAGRSGMKEAVVPGTSAGEFSSQPVAVNSSMPTAGKARASS